jgi:hypothetical protein
LFVQSGVEFGGSRILPAVGRATVASCVSLEGSAEKKRNEPICKKPNAKLDRQQEFMRHALQGFRPERAAGGRVYRWLLTDRVDIPSRRSQG